MELLFFPKCYFTITILAAMTERWSIGTRSGTCNGGGISNRPVRGYRQGLQTGATGRVRQVRQRGAMYLCGRIPLEKLISSLQQDPPQFNHKTCYLSGGFVVQAWWVCGPTLWWGCGGVVGLYPTTPTPHNGHTCPPTFLMQFHAPVPHILCLTVSPPREHTSKYFIKYFKY